MPEDQPRPRRPAPQGARGLTTPPADAGGRRVARNTLLSAIGEGSNVFLFLLGFLAARLLGPVGFGEYSAAFAFVGLFRILPDFGMSYASTLAISRDRGQAASLTGNLLGFQALLSVVTLAACLGLGRQLFDGVTWIAVLVLSFDLVFKSVKSTLRWLLKAFERFGVEALSLAAERTALLALGVAALLAGHGVVGFVLVFALVRLVDTTALALWVDRRLLPLRPAADRATWLELLRRGLPFAYAGLMITLFFQVDAVMLEQMRGAREVGFYSAPVRILEGLTLVPRIIGYAFIPTMAALAGPRPEAVTELYRRGSKYLLLAGLVVAAFGLLASDAFIPWLFGTAYAPSVGVSRILIAAAAFMFLSNFGETTLACVNRWGTIVAVSTAALALNVTLNLLWIPRYGYPGAAWATVLTEGLYFLLTALALRRYGHRIGWPSLVVRPVLVALVFATVVAAARPLGFLAAGALGTLAAAATSFPLGVWDSRERALLAGFLRRGRPDRQAGPP